jgi:hypothetical protein
MPKSNEQKIVDSFENSTMQFNPSTFARILSEGTPQVQYTFYDSMIAYITYKAVYADHYSETLPKDSVVVVCQYLRDCLQDYFPEVQHTATRHYERPELI